MEDKFTFWVYIRTCVQLTITDGDKMKQQAFNCSTHLHWNKSKSLLHSLINIYWKTEAQHAVQCMKTKQQHQKEPEASFPIFLYHVFRSGEWSDARKTQRLPSEGYISHPDSSVTAWATASPLVILSERQRENRQNKGKTKDVCSISPSVFMERQTLLCLLPLEKQRDQIQAQDGL